MKISLLFIAVFSITSFAMDRASCDTYTDRPKLTSQYEAPSFGPYIKSKPFYVTAGKNDPYSEEILYFLITQELNKKTSSIGTSSDYLKFHNYFKKKMKELEDQGEAWEVVGSDQLYPVVKEYLNQNWLKLSDSEFKNILSQTQKKLDTIKEIFAFKSNTTYYKITPIDTEVTLDTSSSLPKVTLKNDYGVVSAVITSSGLTHYESINEENEYKKKLIEENKEELSYIAKTLPSSGAPLKGTLQEFLISK